MPMTKIVLRVRLIGGDTLDVAYEADGAEDENAERAIAALAADNGVLRCQHGDRLMVLYGRGVATVEVAPRGAVLLPPGPAGQSLTIRVNGDVTRTLVGAKSTTTAVSPSTRMTRPRPYLSCVTMSSTSYCSTGGASGGGLKGLEGR
jgi:hypothetical protein